jgi:peptidyl-prolyl cis-trans isomerase C
MASFAQATDVFARAQPAAVDAQPKFAWLARLARRRMVQFVVFGGAIFLASSLARGSGDAIAFTGSELDLLRNAEAHKKGMDPKSLALAGQIKERALEDEILYREGLKLGFDKDDGVVKQRIIQKTLFLAEELAGASEPPTDAELAKFFEATRGAWLRPERWQLVQAFARDRATIDDLFARASRGEDVSRLGDPCPVPRVAGMTSKQLASLLGDGFVAALPSAPADSFSAPIRSALGWHIVRIKEHSLEAPETFEEARGALRGAYVVKRREEAVAAFLDRAFPKYSVTIDGEKVGAIRPQGRVAVRSPGSAED